MQLGVAGCVACCRTLIVQRVQFRVTESSVVAIIKCCSRDICTRVFFKYRLNIVLD